MKKFSILYTVDVNYFKHMLTSLYSLLENNKDIPLTIYIIEENFTTSERHILELLIENYDNVDLKIYSWNPDSEKFRLPRWKDTDIANARLFSKELLPDVRKILYLDSDTIIVDSLSSLLSKETTNPIEAVLDYGIPLHMKDKVNQYFNSGVLLMDYELWEKDDCTKTLYDTFRENETIPFVFPDQDLLNLALSENIKKLSIDYNISPKIKDLVKYPYLGKRYCAKYPYYDYEEIVKAEKSPHIYHMINYLNAKPWDFNNHHPFSPIYEKYRMKLDTEYKSVSINDTNLLLEIMIFTNLVIDCSLSDSFKTSVKKLAKQMVYKKN